MNTTYDVIIAGTGPAGLTLANILGRLKVRTLVLERDPGLSGQPKALNIDDEFFRLLEAVGLGDPVRAHAKFPISYDYISPTGLNLGHVEGRLTEHNFPNRAATFQPEFEPILAEGARRTGYAEIAFDRELVSFTNSANGVQISSRSCGGEDFQYSAKFLVGADGAHSTVRKLLGLPFEEVDRFDVRHVVVDVRDDIDPSPLALTKMGWRRNFFSMPAPNGRRFEFSLRANESAELALNDDTLRQWFAPFRDYDKLDVIRKVVHTFRARVVPQLRQGRVFLIGDAAHLMPVFGSQGMNSGARDANNLGWKLASVLRGGASPDILDTYHDERWDAVRKTVRMATVNGKLQAVKCVPMSLLRDVFFGILRLVPPANRYIREMKYIPKAFLRSALVRPGGETGRKDEYVGRLNPNPAVSAGDSTGLLDEFIGLRFAILGIDVGQQQVPVAVADIAQRLDAVCINLLPADAGRSFRTEGVANLHVQDGRYAPVFRRYTGQWVLVRPDRVVAVTGPTPDFVRECMALLGTMHDAAR